MLVSPDAHRGHSTKWLKVFPDDGQRCGRDAHRQEIVGRACAQKPTGAFTERGRGVPGIRPNRHWPNVPRYPSGKRVHPEVVYISHADGTDVIWITARGLQECPMSKSALGWLGLAIAEEHGGSGFGLSELAVVQEAHGRELTPGPFLPTVAASLVIDRCASDSLRAQLLPGLADGTTVAALGLAGSVVVGSDLDVTGEIPAVLGAPDADVLVLIAGDDVVVVDATTDGVTVTALEPLDT